MVKKTYEEAVMQKEGLLQYHEELINIIIKNYAF